MIEFVLTEPDLTGIRFAISPLNELTLSLRALNDPGRYPLHLRWIREVVEARDRLDLPVLRALTTDRGWTPDFLSPRPESPLTRIEDELDAVRATAPDVVRRDLRAVFGRVPRQLHGPPERVLHRVADALERYWEQAFAPFWPRMRDLLETDIAYRGRVLTRAGLDAMLGGLSERVRFDSPVVRVDIAGAGSRRIGTRGAGLTLVPTLFALRTAVPLETTAPPMLIYSARGVATLWERSAAPAPKAVSDVIGITRTRLLAMLTEPLSSTTVASRERVTVSAANQHLRALRAAGLLTSYRNGRQVFYTRSELGDSLLQAGRLVTPG